MRVLHPWTGRCRPRQRSTIILFATLLKRRTPAALSKTQPANINLRTTSFGSSQFFEIFSLVHCDGLLRLGEHDNHRADAARPSAMRSGRVAEIHAAHDAAIRAHVPPIGLAGVCALVHQLGSACRAVYRGPPCGWSLILMLIVALLQSVGS